MAAQRAQVGRRLRFVKNNLLGGHRHLIAGRGRPGRRRQRFVPLRELALVDKSRRDNFDPGAVQGVENTFAQVGFGGQQLADIG